MTADKDSPDTPDQSYEAELARLRAEEERKRAMFRDVADPNTLTPDRAFVERHMGPAKSDAELQAEARAHAEKLQRQAEAEARRQQEVRKSLEAHNARLEERQAQQTQSAADRHRAQKTGDKGPKDPQAPGKRK